MSKTWGIRHTPVAVSPKFEPMSITFKGKSLENMTTEEKKKEEEKKKLCNQFICSHLAKNLKVTFRSQMELKNYHYIYGEVDFLNNEYEFLLKIDENGEFIDFIDFPEWIDDYYREMNEKAIIQKIQAQGLRFITSPVGEPYDSQKPQFLRSIFNYHFERNELHHVMEVEDDGEGN